MSLAVMMSNLSRRLLMSCCGVLWMSLSVPLFATPPDQVIPARDILTLQAGAFLTPERGTGMLLLTIGSLRPYTLFRSEPAHEKIRMKYELSLGAAQGDENGVLISAGMLAHRYLTGTSDSGARPYIEGGIGLIYTSYRIPGQGLSLNFNPQIGVGLEFLDAAGGHYHTALRLHHVSNGGLDKDNRGINAVLLSVGHDF